VLGLLENDSIFFQQNPPRPLPHFDRSQIEIGKVLGEGEFGVVCEVKEFFVSDECHCSVCISDRKKSAPDSPPVKKLVVSGMPLHAHKTRKESGSRVSFADVPITIDDIENLREADEQDEKIPLFVEQELEYSSDESDIDNVPDDFEQREERGFMKAHCYRNGLARYAVKRIRKDIPDECKEDAAIDLASEAKFLTSLSHPNIVKLRAVVGVPGHSDFLMVMDRLYMTLDQKIAEWRKAEKSYKGFLGHFGRRQEDLNQVRMDRMVALYDISRAMRYLHSNNIIYRDQKPENIGFDVRGDAKLFDLGLAKELKRKDLVTPPDAYEASGMTGSRRYMAPEVVLCKNYGLSADVYSYAILFWQVMALEMPFAKYDFDQHFSKVVLKGERPKRLSFLSPMITRLLDDCWSPKTSVRPGFKRITETLRGELTIAEKRGNAELNDRTTHLMDMSYNSRFGFNHLTTVSLRSRQEIRDDSDR
jgi:serine/threonine protein kinase